MKGYPYWKVGLGFLLCPGIASVIAALVGTYYQILNQKVSFLMVLGFFSGTSPVIVFLLLLLIFHRILFCLWFCCFFSPFSVFDEFVFLFLFLVGLSLFSGLSTYRR